MILEVLLYVGLLHLRTEDDYEPVNRWWEREDGAESGKRGAKKWDPFEHHGCLGQLLGVQSQCVSEEGE